MKMKEVRPPLLRSGVEPRSGIFTSLQLTQLLAET